MLVLGSVQNAVIAVPCTACSWNAGKKFMGNVDAFLKSLLNFDKDNIPGEKCAKSVLGCSF